MKVFLGFFSITIGTQICLAINQLVLLPLQLRVWGQTTTSHWLVIVAIANLATIGDLGLRVTGHAQLLASVRTGDAQARLYFSRIWALARSLMLGLGIALLIAEAVPALESKMTLEAWTFAVTVALVLDTMITVRGVWLDTLGHFNKVEGLFFGMVAARVLLSILCLVAFHTGPAVLGYVMLLTAVLATTGQAYLVPGTNYLAWFAGGFKDLQWRSLAVVRFAVAEPASNWMRYSLPVMVLAASLSLHVVTIYVAIRALFGLARQVVSQLSRYASIRFAQRVEGDRKAAEAIIVLFVLLSTLVGLSVSCAVIADHGRLLRLWLNGANTQVEAWIALSFAAGAVGYGYQVIAAALMRSGNIAGVARRQYVYLLAGALSATIGYLTGSIIIYALLLAVQELLIAGMFVFGLGRRIFMASVATFMIAAVLVSSLWIATIIDVGGIFSQFSLVDIGESLALAIALTGVALAFYAGLYVCFFERPMMKPAVAP